MNNEIYSSFILANLLDVESKGHNLLCKWLPRKVYATDKKKVQQDNKTVVTKKKRLLYGGIAKKIMQYTKWTPKTISTSVSTIGIML